MTSLLPAINLIVCRRCVDRRQIDVPATRQQQSHTVLRSMQIQYFRGRYVFVPCSLLRSCRLPLSHSCLGYACGRTQQAGMLTVVRRTVPVSTRPRRGAAAAAASAQSSSSNIYQPQLTGENISATIGISFPRSCSRPNSNSSNSNNCSASSSSGGGGSSGSFPRSVTLLDAAGPTSRSSTASSQSYSSFGSPKWAATPAGRGVTSRKTDSPKPRVFSSSAIDLRVTSYCGRSPGGSHRGGRGRCGGGVPSAAAGADMVANVRTSLEYVVSIFYFFHFHHTAVPTFIGQST